MIDRRKSRRISAPEPVPVKDSATRVTVGFLRDLSIHGMMITGKGPFAVDRKYKLKLVLPRPVMNTRTLDFDAVCKWKSRTPDQKSYEAGFEFSTVSEEMELLIVLIQAEYAVKALPTEVNC